jgi:CRP-like cAMP-binding protein
MSGEEPKEVSLEALSSVFLFEGLSHDTLTDLKKRLQHKFYPRGSYVVKIGDSAEEMYFIMDGQVEYVDAKYRVFSHGNPGEFFGELGLIYGIPRTAHVRASTDIHAYVLKKKDFDDIRADNPVIKRKVESIAAKRFQNFKYELVKLAFQPSDQTYTETQLQSFREVFYIYNKNGVLDEDGLTIMLAHLSGKEFSKEEVATVLKSLDADKDGVISFEDFVAKIRTLKWLLDPKDARKYSDKIQKDLLEEEEKNSWIPEIDLKSLGIGAVVGGLVVFIGAFFHHGRKE